MVESSTLGSSTNVRSATGPGIGQSSNAGMSATLMRPRSKHCSPTIRIGFEQRHSILKRSKSKSQRIDEFAEFEVRKELLREAAGWKHLQIEFSISFPASARLDRLLASELRVSRSRLMALHAAGLLKAKPERTDVLRRRIRNGARVSLDLSGEDDRELVWKPPAIGEKA